MQDDLSASGRSIERVEQQVRDDLYNFALERHNCSIRLNALAKFDPLFLRLGTIKVRYFAEYRFLFEFRGLIAIAVKLKRMRSDATQTLQLRIQRRDISTRFGAGLERSQQEYQIRHCF